MSWAGSFLGTKLGGEWADAGLLVDQIVESKQESGFGANARVDGLHRNSGWPRPPGRRHYGAEFDG